MAKSFQKRKYKVKVSHFLWHFWIMWNCFVFLAGNSVDRRNSLGHLAKIAQMHLNISKWKTILPSLRVSSPEALYVLCAVSSSLAHSNYSASICWVKKWVNILCTWYIDQNGIVIISGPPLCVTVTKSHTRTHTHRVNTE